MPGGGSVTMANHLYRSAPRDGTVLGYSLPGLVAAQLMEPDRAKYDGQELKWIGSAITVTNAIAVLNDTPVETLEDVRDTEIIIGATKKPKVAIPTESKTFSCLIFLLDIPRASCARTYL